MKSSGQERRKPGGHGVGEQRARASVPRGVVGHRFTQNGAPEPRRRDPHSLPLSAAAAGFADAGEACFGKPARRVAISGLLTLRAAMWHWRT